MTACSGGGGGVDSLDAYRKQTVLWGACEGVPEVIDKNVVDRMQCTTLQVPMDYENPKGRNLDIGVSRVKAIPSEVKSEPLFFNPGGPGGSGYLFGAIFAHGWTSGENLTPQDLNYRVQQNFDLIGFDPRGVGKSTPLECQSDRMLEPVDNSSAGRAPVNMATQLRNAETIATACGSNSLTPFINTDATARDLDLMREILGGDKLNFYGASYGTWLGMWYAGLFPERIGRLVLDSSVDFTSSMQGIMLQQGPSLSRVFNEVLAPYAARHPNIFKLGGDVAAIQNSMLLLNPLVRAATARKIYNKLFNSQHAPEVFDYILVGQRLSQPPFEPLWPQGMTGGDFAALKILIEQADFSITEKTYADAIVQEIESKQQRRPVKDEEVDPVYTAVVCNDTLPLNTSPEWWAEQETIFLTKYPLAGTGDVRSCQYWRRPINVVKPSMAAMKNMDILMLQSEFDGATPVEGAMARFFQLPKSHMVYVSGGMDHGVALGNKCSGNYLVNYLLGVSPDKRTTICPADPLTEDVAEG